MMQNTLWSEAAGGLFPLQGGAWSCCPRALERRVAGAPQVRTVLFLARGAAGAEVGLWYEWAPAPAARGTGAPGTLPVIAPILDPSDSYHWYFGLGILRLECES